jgi:hypothetical protein
VPLRRRHLADQQLLGAVCGGGRHKAALAAATRPPAGAQARQRRESASPIVITDPPQQHADSLGASLTRVACWRRGARPWRPLARLGRRRWCAA